MPPTTNEWDTEPETLPSRALVLDDRAQAKRIAIIPAFMANRVIDLNSLELLPVT
jgi:hypothetical protein